MFLEGKGFLEGLDGVLSKGFWRLKNYLVLLFWCFGLTKVPFGDYFFSRLLEQIQD